MHYHGIPHFCPRDYAKAFQYYNIAAENGSQQAWKNLASMYMLGEGVPKSIETAEHIMQVFSNETNDR